MPPRADYVDIVKGADLGWRSGPCKFTWPDITEAQTLARVASAFEEEGIDHVLWGFSAQVLHGAIANYDQVDYHFVLPDDSIHRALKALLVTGRAKLESLDVQPCRGEKDCPVLYPKELPFDIYNIKLPEFIPRPAQHVHCTLGLDDEKGSGWISLHKQSAMLPWIDSLEARPPPPDGSPGSAWGVVPADVYRSNFFGRSCDSTVENPSLYPIRILPPHLLAKAYIYLMCRAEPKSLEEQTWADRFRYMVEEYYPPEHAEDKRRVRTATLDPKLLPLHYLRYHQRMLSIIAPLTRAERLNELRAAEGCPLWDPGLAHQLPPPELIRDDDQVSAAIAAQEEERRGGDSGAGRMDPGAAEEWTDALAQAFDMVLSEPKKPSDSEQ